MQQTIVNAWEEVMGKEIQMKKFKVGSGEIASMGTVVSCSVKGYIQNDTEVYTSPFEVLSNQQFKIGESDAFPGLELSLRHSKVGEIFAMKCSTRFGFGTNGRPAVGLIPAIPSDADLYYEVEVTAHRNEDVVDHEIISNIAPNQAENEEISPENRAEYARRVAIRDILLRKDCGNRWFSYQVRFC